LCVDVDELFDYPFSDRVSITALLNYLRSKSYTAVVAHLLDMFSDTPLDELNSAPHDDLRRKYRYYDISDITKEDYALRYGRYNKASNPDITFYFGGIRRILFGTDDWLSKHPLVFCDGRVIPIRTGHDVYNAHIADITCVLYHFKFLSDFREFTRRAVREGGYFNNSQAYRQYNQVLEKAPDLQIKQPTAQELREPSELIDNNFLVISDDYVNLALGRRAA
jgi:hypothetical protein